MCSDHIYYVSVNGLPGLVFTMFLAVFTSHKNINCYKNLIIILELLQQAIFECASKPYISML